MSSQAQEVPRAGRFPYRMKDLCELTGLPRQVIHFYIQQGLVPHGHKTGPNMAYYGELHLKRLQLIRQLQHERFLPLKAIRALLTNDQESFSPGQKQFLDAVKTYLSQLIPARASHPETVDALQLAQQLGLQKADLQALQKLDLLVVQSGPDGRQLIAREDTWLLELVASLRQVGFGPQLGFAVEDLAMYEEAISQLFERECLLLRTRLSALSPQQAAQMLQRAIPLIHMFWVRSHENKIRLFLATL